MQYRVGRAAKYGRYISADSPEEAIEHYINAEKRGMRTVPSKVFVAEVPEAVEYVPTTMTVWVPQV